MADEHTKKVVTRWGTTERVWSQLVALGLEPLWGPSAGLGTLTLRLLWTEDDGSHHLALVAHVAEHDHQLTVRRAPTGTDVVVGEGANGLAGAHRDLEPVEVKLIREWAGKLSGRVGSTEPAEGPGFFELARSRRYVAGVEGDDEISVQAFEKGRTWARDLLA